MIHLHCMIKNLYLVIGVFNMDIAAMSVIMANQQVKVDAGLAVMSNVKNVAEQQGEQLIEMLETAVPSAPHPAKGQSIDLRA